MTFRHPRFGQFTLDRRSDCFEAEVAWGRENIRLSLSARTEDNAIRLLKVADRLWEDQATWDRRIRDKAVGDLLATRNESWREDGEAKMNADEFASRMHATSVSIEADETFGFWFDDGDLFWGHIIFVDCNEKGPVEASIHG